MATTPDGPAWEAKDGSRVIVDRIKAKPPVTVREDAGKEAGDLRSPRSARPRTLTAA